MQRTRKAVGQDPHHDWRDADREAPEVERPEPVAHEPPLVEDLDADDDPDFLDEAAETEARTTDDSHGADDALGRYLRQMGAIPCSTASRS